MKYQWLRKCKNEDHSFKETPVKYERQYNTLCVLGVQIYKIQSRKEWEMNKLRLWVVRLKSPFHLVLIYILNLVSVTCTEHYAYSR